MRKTATKTNKINRKPPPAKMPPMIANGSPRYRRDNAMYTRPPAITQSENGFCRIRAHIPPVPATESPAAGPARISGTLRLRSPWSMFRGISHPGTEARSTNRLERDRTRAPPCARFGSSRAVPSRRSEEHTSELQSQSNIVCRLLLETEKRLGNIIIKSLPPLNLTKKTTAPVALVVIGARLALGIRQTYTRLPLSVAQCRVCLYRPIR